MCLVGRDVARFCCSVVRVYVSGVVRVAAFRARNVSETSVQQGQRVELFHCICAMQNIWRTTRTVPYARTSRMVDARGHGPAAPNSRGVSRPPTPRAPQRHASSPLRTHALVRYPADMTADLTTSTRPRARQTETYDTSVTSLSSRHTPAVAHGGVAHRQRQRSGARARPFPRWPS